MTLSECSIIHISDLHQEVDQTTLSQVFSEFGQVKTCHIVNRSQNNKPNTALIGYEFKIEADNAIAKGNLREIRGFPCRVSLALLNKDIVIVEDPHFCLTKIWITLSEAAIKNIINVVSKVKSCNISLDANCRSKGFGFVTLKNVSDVPKVMEKLGNENTNSLFKINIYKPSLKIEEVHVSEVYVKNFDTLFNNETLKELFQTFGEVLSAKVVVNEHNVSKGFGFIKFKNAKDGEKAIKDLNGHEVQGRRLCVQKSLPKFEVNRIRQGNGQNKTNLHIKNLSSEVTDNDLKERFSEFGTITSAKVRLDRNGISCQFGYVSFSNADEASLALNTMNETYFMGKLVTVTYFITKGERYQFNQARNHAANDMVYYPLPLPIPMINQNLLINEMGQLDLN